ncbi:MAG: hypothetical protein E7302_05760 [Butyrivibrio sp.]|nr:hypothetical protein [Butyrivibrio sp.]
MSKLEKISNILDCFVFAATTLAIAGVFYEGITLKWYTIVGIFVVCMDYSFIPATILYLITGRKNKYFFIHVFSMILIVVAIIMKILGIPYPAITLLLWYFYLWFLYGSILVGRYVRKDVIGRTV